MARELGTFNDTLRDDAIKVLNERLAKLKRDGDVLAGLVSARRRRGHEPG
jgi:hypothetical protein